MRRMTAFLVAALAGALALVAPAAAVPPQPSAICSLYPETGDAVVTVTVTSRLAALYAGATYADGSTLKPEAVYIPLPGPWKTGPANMRTFGVGLGRNATMFNGWA